MHKQLCLYASMTEWNFSSFYKWSLFTFRYFCIPTNLSFCEKHCVILDLGFWQWGLIRVTKIQHVTVIMNPDKNEKKEWSDCMQLQKKGNTYYKYINLIHQKTRIK